MTSPFNNSRRKFLSTIGASASFLTASAAGSTLGNSVSNLTLPFKNDNNHYFQHGVASGDPLAHAVILWTRASRCTGVVDVTYFVALDPEMRNIVQEDVVTTSEERDYTIKVDVQGLNPNTTYYYQFEINGFRSRVGKTKTAPLDTSRARF
ncbi:MAG: PhoD-like phosphatase N-terminal domain-containing protein, partial [Pseudomonadota bacterium]|nr:PhoD-like phosphatase N-terminal domain-containing protein [Pseudomonadota bacterium]